MKSLFWKYFFKIVHPMILYCILFHMKQTAKYPVWHSKVLFCWLTYKLFVSSIEHSASWWKEWMKNRSLCILLSNSLHFPWGGGGASDRFHMFRYLENDLYWFTTLTQHFCDFIAWERWLFYISYDTLILKNWCIHF